MVLVSTGVEGRSLGPVVDETRVDRTRFRTWLVSRLVSKNLGSASFTLISRPRGTRTRNLRIKSPQLCQLS